MFLECGCESSIIHQSSLQQYVLVIEPPSALDHGCSLPPHINYHPCSLLDQTLSNPSLDLDGSILLIVVQLPLDNHLLGQLHRHFEHLEYFLVRQLALGAPLNFL
jgi:hypothetical protein